MGLCWAEEEREKRGSGGEDWNDVIERFETLFFEKFQPPVNRIFGCKASGSHLDIKIPDVFIAKGHGDVGVIVIKLPKLRYAPQNKHFLSSYVKKKNKQRN